MVTGLYYNKHLVNAWFSLSTEPNFRCASRLSYVDALKLSGSRECQINRQWTLITPLALLKWSE